MRKVLVSLLVATTTALTSASAQVVRQTTSLIYTRTSGAALDDAGATAFAISDGDPYGTNPGHKLQIFSWNAVTGTGEQVTSFPEGVDLDPWEFGPSVTDDGSRIAFVLDRRVALVNADGTGLVQLTATPASVERVMIAGNGSRVVFGSTDNLTGANAGHVAQVFAVEANGTGLRQVTSLASQAYGVTVPTISDDGQRIAFLATAGTVDGGAQIAGILQDGTGYHLLTNVSGLQADFSQISGNGQSVAFKSYGSLPVPPGGCMGGTQIDIVDWSGTGLKSLDAPCAGNSAPGWAANPDITDDAQTVFYAAFNLGNEIYRINRDRTGKTKVTDLATQPGPRAECADWVRVAGSGARVSFLCQGGEPWGGPNKDLSLELYATSGTGAGSLQLSRLLDGSSFDPDLTPDGSRIVFASSARPTGDPGFAFEQIFRMAPDGAGLAQVTAFTGGQVTDLSVTDAGDKVAFAHDGNVFLINADGTGLTQLSPNGVQSGDSDAPDVAGNGSVVVLRSKKDLLLEGGVFGSPVYRVAPDGTGLARLSSKTLNASYPRIDSTGTWVVYSAGTQLHRQRVDGTVDQVIGTGAGSDHGIDITADGGLVVYVSAADGNQELYLWSAASGTTRQLTVTTSGINGSPAFSRDGAWVYFWSDAPRFGNETAGSFQLYRLDVATATVQRVGGLAGCAVMDNPYQPPRPMAVNTTGSKAVFGISGDCTGQNADVSGEIFLIDRSGTPTIAVSPGPAPTVVSWTVESGPATYDVIRGSVSSLAFRGDGSVDLGSVVCIEDNSADASTAGSPDGVTPTPGQVFFYLYRGSPGPAAGPGSYGASSSGGERTPSSGNCGG